MSVRIHVQLSPDATVLFARAAQIGKFQEFRTQVTTGLDGVASYLDDILITGKDISDHLRYLERVLEQLQEYGFTLKKSKCSFLQEQVEYLGQMVHADGFSPSSKKISAILNMPEPKNVSQLRSLLGMVQQYSKFPQSLAEMTAKLNTLLRKGTAWNWTSDYVDAYDEIKQQLTATEALVHCNPDKTSYLVVDAP